MVERRAIHRLDDLAIRLPTVEDLIVVKVVAHRPQDLLDIQALVEANSDPELHCIERWVREFAQALDMPDLWQDIAGWLVGPVQ